jgi:hypothetical protein
MATPAVTAKLRADPLGRKLVDASAEDGVSGWLVTIHPEQLARRYLCYLHLLRIFSFRVAGSCDPKGAVCICVGLKTSPCMPGFSRPDVNHIGDHLSAPYTRGSSYQFI